ncbi:hypothetical protein Daus18300_005665 [Diaporthe australafricana]|uniref:1-alkyl-2-acetylglycerophosphocholine esterase n=1 Tax=Diaporthe australafricana TaxID=127596 RepID=A0ABR3X000_9PEZI
MLPLLFKTLLNHASEATAAADRVYFPVPSGDYHVGKTQHVFNLTSPGCPVTPDGYNDTDAYIVVTILFPTEQEPTPATSSKYMDYELARLIEEGWDIPTGELQKLWTTVQWQPPVLSNLQEKLKFPTLLFSPGGGMPCSSSTLVTSDMVSQGYTVVCIDHPGEAPYLQIPYTNGTAGMYGIAIDYDWAGEQVLCDVNDRRKQGVDALLQLYPALVDDFGAPFNTSAYLHFGFSMGGSLGSDIVERHDAVLAGVNYDGMFIDSYFSNTTVDVRKPFLMFRDDQGRETTDPTWDWFQGYQTGWWRHLKVLGSHHLDFSDVGLWFELLGVNDTGPLTGTIEPLRMREVMNAFTMEFFESVLRGDLGESPLLNGPLPSDQWPEVLLWNGSAVTVSV